MLEENIEDSASAETTTDVVLPAEIVNTKEVRCLADFSVQQQLAQKGKDGRDGELPIELPSC